MAYVLKKIFACMVDTDGLAVQQWNLLLGLWCHGMFKWLPSDPPSAWLIGTRTPDAFDAAALPQSVPHLTRDSCIALFRRFAACPKCVPACVCYVLYLKSWLCSFQQSEGRATGTLAHMSMFTLLLRSWSDDVTWCHHFAEILRVLTCFLF